MTTHSSIKPTPITSADTIQVHGKHLYKLDGTPFQIKGIAFPTPPENLKDSNHGYNATAWTAILHQLINDDLEFNTIRLYRLNSAVDYSEFFEQAAQLGIYVVVPLTSAEGHGVLDRKLAAPKCYKSKLFIYGTQVVRDYLRHPNVLAGMVGNEVMNDEKAWMAAPCVRAYARDLKRYMNDMVEVGVVNRTLPLIYAAQDSATIGGATVDKDEVMKYTVDYLTCTQESEGNAMSPIDMYGVNIESWCSSTQNFHVNPDGTPGSYYSLWKAVRNSSVPIIFSEMGCPHSQFDRDDLERKTKEGTRDWAQIPIVTNKMADSWSGFIAYTYDGPQDFVMFTGGPWNGKATLEPTKDFDNFKSQLHHISHHDETKNISWIEHDSEYPPRQCEEVEVDLLECCDVRLFSDNKMPSYVKHVDAKTGRVQSNNMWITTVAFLIALAATAWIHRRSQSKRDLVEGISLLNGNGKDVEYNSVSN